MRGRYTPIFFVIVLIASVLPACNSDSKNRDMAKDTALSAETRAWSQKIIDDPKRDDYYAERAMVLISNDINYKLAIEDLEMAIKLKPDQYEYYSKLGDAYFGDNQTFKAKETYLKAIERNPHNAELLFKCGQFFLFVKKYEDAKRYLNETIKEDPGYPKVYFFMGQCFKETQDTARAIEYYKKSIQIDAGDYDSYIQLGQIFTQQNNPEALVYLNGAINTDNSNDEGWYARGFYYQMVGETDKAILDYQKTITINPYHAYAYYNAGYIYFSKKNWTIAKRHFELSFKANNSFEKPIYMLGLTAEAENKNDEALTYFKRCLQLNPDFELAKEGILRLEKTNG